MNGIKGPHEVDRNLGDVTDRFDDERPSGREDRDDDSGTDRSILDRLLSPPPFRTPASARSWSVLIVAYLAGAYYLTGWVLPRLLREAPDLNFYVVQPVMWSALAVIGYVGWRRLATRPPFSWTLVSAGVLVGLFHLSVLVIGGVFVGFGRSGSGIRLVNYPLNALYLGTMLVGLEVSRAYLYAVWKEWSERIAFGTVTVLIFVAATPAARFLSLDDPDRIFRIGGGLLLPALVVSGVATWMAARSGPGPAIAYQAVLLIPAWFSPIRPDLPWALSLLLGTATPLVALALYRGIGEDDLPEEIDSTEAQAMRSRPWIRWIATAGVVVLIVGFFSGVFGVRPYIVSGISMEPALEAGDVVILLEGFEPKDLQEGDIVKYDRGVLPVVHRVVSVDNGQHGLVVTTRGDNVLSPDPPIDGEEIDGKVVFAIPWIGKIVLWIRGEHPNG